MNYTNKLQNIENQKDGIIFFIKKPGITSFSALNTIKKALNTKKAGHTGTLDSFAQGLLIVCVGRLTKLAGKITEFDKTYKAVIKFGEETDTYEYTGKVTKKAKLPYKSEFENAVKRFTGEILQKPPVFSAIRINGERSSDLARNGNQPEIPARKITVFSSEILDTVCNQKNQVEYALVEFHVSKGTYIRSLAFDIGRECDSAAHLAGLYRTKIGNFSAEDAAGFDKKDFFSIKSAIETMNEYLKEKESLKNPEKSEITEDEIALKQEIIEKKQNFTPQFAAQCGFKSVYLANEKACKDFKNGKTLNCDFFEKTDTVKKTPKNTETAVFNRENEFAGIIEKDSNNRLKYKFVVN